MSVDGEWMRLGQDRKDGTLKRLILSSGWKKVDDELTHTSILQVKNVRVAVFLCLVEHPSE